MCCRNVIKELEVGITSLKEEIMQKYTLCEELEEAQKETAICSKRENSKLKKEKVMRKKIQFSAK